MVQEETLVDSFTQWAEAAEPRLRHALTAAFGWQVACDAAEDALAEAWVRWDEIKTKQNLIGYVYGIGRNKARRMATRRKPVFVEVPPDRLPHVEPALPSAIARLPEKQRIVVTLLYGYEWTMSEVAELLGTAKTTVQNHSDRGLARLRESLGVDL
jgi:DNA-directed RNA polymerase specialized sigma24 family protein